MIFKHLFRPKYQHKDPQVRIQAIEDLSASEPEDKSILHELAFNDESPKVQLAALEKLDSFTLWWKLSETSKNERIKRRAFQMVESIVLDTSSDKLSSKERQSFIKECRHNALLEALILDTGIQQDAVLSEHILTRLNKPHLTQKVLFTTCNPALQLTLLAPMEDESVLQKAARKLNAPEPLQLVQQKLNGLKLAKQKPLEIGKLVSLVLSKLLALVDSSDLEVLRGRRSELEAEYQTIATEFHWLSAEQNTEYTEKYRSIGAKLDKLEQKLEPEWLALQQQQQQQKHSALLMDKARAVLVEFEQQLASLLQQFEPDTANAITEKLQQTLTELEQALAGKEKERLMVQLQQGKSTLAGLPEFQQQLQQARDLLASFQQEECPTEKHLLDAGFQRLNQVRSDWKQLKRQHLAFWPQELEQSWKQITGQWQQQLKQIKQELEQDSKYCRNKLRQVQNMVQQGKYNAAIGVYGKLQQMYLLLPEKQQAFLKRQFQAVQQKVENLQDWQAYIAQPRKPALLEQIKTLVDKPLAIQQQAEQVKALRQEWNSLGKLDSEEDHILNQAFDAACELAFAPCREFYAEQEQQRAQNLVMKQQLMAQLSALDLDVIESKTLIKEFRQLQQQWRDIGEVDYKQHSVVNRQYALLCEPIRNKVQAFYTDNAGLKQKLIKDAEQLLALDDMREATDLAKQLQQQWKSVEYAGKQDNNLWQQFRQVNDQLFQRKQALDSSRREQNDEIVKQLKQLLEQGQNTLLQAKDKAEIARALDMASTQFADLLQQLPVKLARQYEGLWQQLKSSQQDKLKQQQVLKQQQLYLDVLAFAEVWQQQVPDGVQDLPQQWKNCFDTSEQEFDRLQLTVLMEIIAEKESKVENAQLRQELQLKLMASKLEQGISYTLENLLQQWLKQGPLSDSDLVLLPRVQQLFAL